METVRYASKKILYIPIQQIAPTPRQPRQVFSPEELEALSQSIRLHGILQPLTVRRGKQSYVLVAGERRLRAAGLAGLSRVPCLLVEGTGADSAVLALVENLQRSDLHYLEEAQAIARLITDYHMSQEEAAAKLGRSQPAVANKLRLLRLSVPCQDLLRQYGLTERHARALLRLEREEDRLAVLRKAGEEKLTVAQTEACIEERLHQIQTTPPQGRRTFILKDVRLFLNSLDRSVSLMREAGVDAELRREENDQGLVVTVSIRRARK